MECSKWLEITTSYTNIRARVRSGLIAVTFAITRVYLRTYYEILLKQLTH